MKSQKNNILELYEFMENLPDESHVMDTLTEDTLIADITLPANLEGDVAPIVDKHLITAMRSGAIKLKGKTTERVAVTECEQNKRY